MADNLNVYKFCSRCKGSGLVSINIEPYDTEEEGGSITCPDCSGEGKLLWGVMLEKEA